VRRCLLAMLLGLLLLPACTVRTTQQAAVVPTAPPSQEFHGVWQDRPLRMPKETLTDTAGQPFNLRTSPSRPIRLVYLGYIDCPNICVTMLSDLAAGLQRLDPSVRADIEFLFVDIRPEQDTPAELRNWLTRFDPEFTGLLGSPTQVERIAGQLGVAMHDDGAQGLLHSAQIIGFDRQGQGVMVWSPGLTPDQLSQDLALLAARQR
jgi:protein SCO1/2